MLAIVILQNVFDLAIQLNKIASLHTGYIRSVPQTFFFFTINDLSILLFLSIFILYYPLLIVKLDA